MSAKGRVKWPGKQPPSSLERMLSRTFDERSEPGKPQVFRVSARNLWKMVHLMAKIKELSFYKKKKKISSAAVREVFTWIFGILVSIFVAGVLVYFLGITTNVVGVSMEPSLYNEQKVFVNRFIYVVSSPHRGDVVVFLPNGNHNAHYYVKRVVAVPGDKIVISNGVLYVNGIESSWVTERILEPGIAENEMTLDIGEYFCIGDNPGNSEDSRSANIGPVQESDIIGKVWFRAACDELGMGFVK